MIGFSDPNLLNELIDQSRNPPGKDSVIGNFYAAIVEMLEESNKIWKIFVKEKKKRTDITNKHLVNLIFRSFQAIKLEQKDLTYRFFTDTKNWRKELNLLESDDKLR